MKWKFKCLQKNRAYVFIIWYFWKNIAYISFPVLCCFWLHTTRYWHIPRLQELHFIRGSKFQKSYELLSIICHLHALVKMHKYQSTFSFISYWISSDYSYVLILMKLLYAELEIAGGKNYMSGFSNTSQNIILQYFLSDKGHIIL